MAFIILIFIVAAAISSVAAYFSLVGLGSIFAATFWGVVIMGGALEVGKIVTTKWVHSNWRNPDAPWYFRGLLCFFVASLMAITSLGIYGYLSRGHLEQQAPLAGLGIQVAQLEQQVKQKQDENVRLESRLSQISKITDKVLEGNGKAGLRASQQQKKEAATIQGTMDANNQTINDLTTKLVPLKMKTGDVQGELGVAKFIAEAFGWEPEKAIRIIIGLIMSAFDTLALSMFIMGSISLKNHREAKRRERDGELGDVLPIEELVVPMPAVEEPKADSILENIEPIKGPGHSFDLAPETTWGLDEDYHPIPVKIADVPEKLFEAKLETIIERDNRDEELAAAKAAIDKEREEFEAAMADVSKQITLEVNDLEAAKAQVIADQAALQTAHEQLLDMEARINDERELLSEWNKDLTAQQNAINEWKPERHDMDDGKNPKDLIIEVLEMNPDIVNDIVQVATALQNARPGL